MSAIQQMLVAGAPIKYVLPTYVGITNGINSTSFNLAAVAGAVANDIIVVATLTNCSDYARPPFAFTSIGSNAITSQRMAMYWSRLSGADSTTLISVPTEAGGFVVASKILIRGAALAGNPIASFSTANSSGTTIPFGTGGNAAENNTLMVGAAGPYSTAGSFSSASYVGTSKTNITERRDSWFGSAGGSANLVIITADCPNPGLGGTVTSTATSSLSSVIGLSARVKGQPI